MTPGRKFLPLPSAAVMRTSSHGLSDSPKTQETRVARSCESDGSMDF